MEGKAQAKVELELEENQLTAGVVADMDEKTLGKLYRYLIGVLEDEAHLTPEKKGPVSNPGNEPGLDAA